MEAKNNNLEIFTRLFFTKRGNDKEFVSEAVPKLMFTQLPFGACPFLHLRFNNAFLWGVEFEDKTYCFTNLGYAPRTIFNGDCAIRKADILSWIKDRCETNFDVIIKETGYDINHTPVNNYREKDCPYCKKIYPNLCGKHAALLSWHSSSRNAYRYFPTILDIGLGINYTYWNFEGLIKQVFIRPTATIEIAIIKDDTYSLYRRGKWFTYYRDE